MNSRIIATLSIFIVAAAISGCGQSEAEANKRTVVPSATTPVSGKILYRWAGFDEKQFGRKAGYCIYANGKTEEAFPDASYVSWVEDNVVLKRLGKDLSGTESGIQIINIATNELITQFTIPKGAVRPQLLSDKQRVLLKVREKVDTVATENIAVFDLEKNEIQKVTQFQVGEPWTILGFDLSPDESRIAYSIGDHSDPRGWEILIVDLEGNLLEKIPVKGGLDPRWSPDGSKIVFDAPYPEDPYSNRTNLGITLYDLETKELKRLTHHHSIASEPDFSPDGKQIVYVLWGDGGRANNLAVINTDGTGFQTLLPEDHIRQGQVSNPDWGP